MLKTFADRLRHLRWTLGSKGRDTTVRGWAREMGVTHGKARFWEKGNHPKRGIPELTDALGKVDGVRARSLDANALAAWVYTGQGDPPTGPKTTVLEDHSGVSIVVATPIPTRRSILQALSHGVLTIDEAESKLVLIDAEGRRTPCTSTEWVEELVDVAA